MRLAVVLAAICLLIQTASAVKGNRPYKKHDRPRFKEHGVHHKYGYEHPVSGKDFKLDIQLQKVKQSHSKLLLDSNNTDRNSTATEGIRPTEFGVIAKILFSGTYMHCNESQSLQCSSRLANCHTLTCATREEVKQRSDPNHACQMPIKCTTELLCDCDNSMGFFRKSNTEAVCLSKKECEALPKAALRKRIRSRKRRNRNRKRKRNRG